MTLLTLGEGRSIKNNIQTYQRSELPVSIKQVKAAPSENYSVSFTTKRLTNTTNFDLSGVLGVEEVNN